MLLGALEAGGTKMVLSTGDEKGNVFERISLPTNAPAETMPAIIDFFKNKNIEALGVGTFGPVDLDPQSATYGYITTTPKTPWVNYPLYDTLKNALNVPVGLDTDVDAAAISEHAQGAAKGLSSCLYVTVGTGIGGGIVTNNRILHGAMHTELGHIIMRPHKNDPMPHGCCHYHDGCLEGLASGTAIEARWHVKAVTLPDDHFAWELEAYYLGQMCANAVLLYSPHRIVLGGGVMHKQHLFPMICKNTQQFLNGYVKIPQIMDDIDSYIVPPALGDNAGAIGALLLGADALAASK